MTHFRAENQDSTSLTTNYPHAPSDLYQSMVDYLEDLFSQGWDLQTFSLRAGSQDWVFVFRANAQ